jgi:hypothetical protein
MIGAIKKIRFGIPIETDVNKMLVQFTTIWLPVLRYGAMNIPTMTTCII